MSFEKTVNDIRSLKIQGAENIAKQAVSSLRFVLKKENKKNITQTINSLDKAKNLLFNTRPTEPCMRNALNFVLLDLRKQTKTENKQEFNDIIESKIKQVLNFFREADKKIIDYGSQKIKDHMTIFTHCHSSTVTGIIKTAWKKTKHIEVHNTETRPRFQGRITAAELAKQGIPVVHYVDSAARFAIKKADIMLIGADAITAEGKVINKVGSELFAELAYRYDIPVYVCTNSWKFDPKTIFGFEEPIEKRFSKEVWSNPPKNVKINNFAFEKIDSDVITGIITELGIYSPESLTQVLQKKYSWMFE